MGWLPQTLRLVLAPADDVLAPHFFLGPVLATAGAICTGSADVPPSMGIEAACLELQKSPAIRAGLPASLAWVFYDEWTDFSFRFFGKDVSSNAL